MGHNANNSYVTAILTAAGFSSRMSGYKPLLKWQNTTLIEYQIKTLFDAGVDEVMVVVGYNYKSITPYIENSKASFVINNKFASGRATSIIEGMKFVSPDTTSIMILGVDQPRNSVIINQLLYQHASLDYLITYPSFDGKGGHPIIFSSLLREELMLISETSSGIRLITEKYKDKINKVEMQEPLVRLDLNTSHEYSEAFARWGSL